MAKSFYHFLMRYRNGGNRDEISQFANDAYFDHSFPTQSKNYDEISRYLEIDVDYLPSMSVFDQAWDLFLQIEKPNEE